MTSRRRRAFGQHFLRDEKAIASILAPFFSELANTPPDTRVLEVGPGQGALTQPLFKGLDKGLYGREVLLVEKDPGLARDWKAALPTLYPSSRILEEDFLELKETDWLPAGGNLAVLSNLPYSTGTAILTRLAARPDRIPFMVLMFQEEVAERLRAKPSTPDRGSLSLWIQNLWEVTKILRVSPRSFEPPPRVFSEVVLLRARDRPMIEATTGREELWQKCLSLAFQNRRKMLRSGAFGNTPRGAEALRRSGVDETARAEALDWAEWGKLFEAFIDSAPSSSNSPRESGTPSGP